MHARDARRYVEYLFWVRDRVLSAAEGLPPGTFAADRPSASRDLRGTLVHELESEWAWRVRLTTGSFPDEGLAPASYPTVESLGVHWRDEERELRAWIETLDAVALAARPSGTANVFPRSDYLMHVVAHAVQEFSEAAVLLSQLGRSPGNLDFIAFCNERG